MIGKWMDMNLSVLFQTADLVADNSPAFTSTVVISGPVIVLTILAVLVVIIYAYGRASKRAAQARQHLTRHEKDKRDGTINGKKPEKRKFREPAPAAPQGVSPEVVAAISAAVYMLEGEGAVVTSIRPLRKNPISSRNPWAAAAIAENTKPF